ncbi:MAG: glutaredoxin family protein [Candidatus Woesearchaeota archaeon]|nr:glutaredoxin family protein [Candidatus Woesearchaeota archaeon]
MKIVLYGASWCPDCTRSKRFLDEHKLKYEYNDLERNPGFADEVIKINEKIGKGPYRSIPLIIIDDKIFLSEPSNQDLGVAVGIFK